MTLDYLNGLNPVQYAAVTTIEGPVMVIAGPGSGKTRVLTFRIAYLIDSKIPPYKILALTFTNKAAKEMKERISSVVGEKGNQVWAGTFHSIFARILRIESEKIGFPSNFTIYDSDDTKNLINSLIKESGLDTNVYNANSVKNRISQAKSNLITPKAYADNPDIQAKDRMNAMPQTGMLYAKYVARCQRAGAMDFDDLLYQTFRLFHQNPDNVLEKYQQKFSHVLVDEFQDTNFLQYAIIKKLCMYEGSPRNICIVGDDAQSIYAFRGATIENILDFERDFNGLQTFKLEQNYRSTPHIVQAANDVITYNKRQIKKEIWTEKPKGEPIRLIKAITDSEEGKRIADSILELKHRYHLSNCEIAILYRTNAQSRIFEEFLRKYNLSYRVFGGLSFYQRKEVKDLLAYLRLTANKRDDEALRRIINYPRRGVGNTSLEKITTWANAHDISLWEATLVFATNSKGKGGLEAFVTMINSFSAKMQTLNVFDLAVYIANKTGIVQDLKGDNTQDGLNRLENIQALLDSIKEFSENDELIDEATMPDKSLQSYLQNIALISDMDQTDKNPDYITLMSVHAAKGLEFRAVFVVGLEENLFPSFQSSETIENIDEERRLFYVAITRAQEFLSLSFAKSRYRYGQIRYNEPSRFLQEIDAQRLDMPAVEAIPNFMGQQRSGVSGLLNKKPIIVAPSFKNTEILNFKASPSSQIMQGMNVLHLRFGKGTVVNIDGNNDSKVATIKFDATGDEEKRIMLKFAKLQILES